MGNSNLNSLSLLFSLLAVCNLLLSATSSTDHVLIQNPLEGLACSLVNCGEGSCVSSNASALGFDCECKPGWKKIQIGAFTYPSCVIPNCTFNFDCSNESPPAPPPPAALLPSKKSDHCDLVWRGEGSCVANDSGHTCQCPSGSENIFGNSSFACLKACSLGVDCNELGILLFGSPPPPPPPPPTNSGNGPTQLASNGSSKLGTLAIILMVAATMQTWF